MDEQSVLQWRDFANPLIMVNPGNENEKTTIEFGIINVSKVDTVNNIDNECIINSNNIQITTLDSSINLSSSTAP